MNGEQDGGIGGYYFLIQNLVLVVGFLLHVLLDRHEDRRTRARVVELAML